MEGKRFVETKRTYRLSSEVVRHGIDQSSSLSVHLSPLSQRCKHRKPEDCGKNLPRARQTAAFWRVLYSRTLFCTKFSSDDLLVSDRTGRFVAVNVETLGNVRMLTDQYPPISQICVIYVICGYDSADE